jgi:hypothetical protein
MPGSKKYQQAGYGFLGMSLIYLLLVYMFMPPFNLGAEGFLYTGIFLLLAGVCSYYIHRGSRNLALVLALIYAARSLVSIYTLSKGEAFTAVPYVLPCLLLTFYLLGRAAWDWP